MLTSVKEAALLSAVTGTDSTNQNITSDTLAAMARIVKITANTRHPVTRLSFLSGLASA